MAKVAVGRGFLRVVSVSIGGNVPECSRRTWRPNRPWHRALSEAPAVAGRPAARRPWQAPCRRYGKNGRSSRRTGVSKRCGTSTRSWSITSMAQPERCLRNDCTTLTLHCVSCGDGLTRSDVDQARKKLLDFLESFQTAYQQSAGSDSGAFSLDKLYGDCTELFLNLLDTIDKYGCGHLRCLRCAVWSA